MRMLGGKAEIRGQRGLGGMPARPIFVQIHARRPACHDGCVNFGRLGDTARNIDVCPIRRSPTQVHMLVDKPQTATHTRRSSVGKPLNPVWRSRRRACQPQVCTIKSSTLFAPNNVGANQRQAARMPRVMFKQIHAANDPAQSHRTRCAACEPHPGMNGL